MGRQNSYITTKKTKNNNKSSITYGRKPSTYNDTITTDLAPKTGQALQVGHQECYGQLQHHPVQDQQVAIRIDPRVGEFDRGELH